MLAYYHDLGCKGTMGFMSERILGIDYGTKRIGLAVSDESGTVAFPREVVQNTKTAVEGIASIVNDEKIEHIVIGESYANDGSDNDIVQDAHAFGDSLQKVSGASVSYEHEFMSSVEADRTLYDAGVRKEVGHVDAHAAAVILQRYLDKQKS